MQKFKFGNPASVVEVSKSPLDRPEPGNRYTIFDCLCRGFGQNNKGPRKTYQITATTPSQAARMAIDFYRKDCFGIGRQNPGAESAQSKIITIFVALTTTNKGHTS